ncbi:MAG: RNA-binding S4 domain-containing protein [Candidatus Woesearchaeota archaeon]|nr:RNA-binding S4 domain-containing protein [Candidatus Woesearchaeota archaeon]
MKTDEQGQYIELADFLKVINLATTGGQAKLLIRSGEVKVDGAVETRVRRKLRNHAIVSCKNNEYKVDLSKLS